MFGVSSVSVKVVFCVAAMGVEEPTRNTRYSEMPLASLDGCQVIWMDVVPTAVAITPDGTLGGVVSPVGGSGSVVAVATDDSADTFGVAAPSYARTV